MKSPPKIAHQSSAARARAPVTIRRERAFEELLLSLKPVVPPAALRAGVLARVAHDAEADAMQGRAIVTVPASNDGWADLAPKEIGRAHV